MYIWKIFQLWNIYSCYRLPGGNTGGDGGDFVSTPGRNIFYSDDGDDDDGDDDDDDDDDFVLITAPVPDIQL